jgi:hypothetical protein
MNWDMLGKRVENYRALIIDDVASDPFVGDRDRFTQQLDGKAGSLKTASEQRRAFLLAHESLRSNTGESTDLVD